MAQFDRLTLLVADLAEREVRVVQLAEDVRCGLGHLGLHRQQLLFLLAEGVRLVTQDARQPQAVGAKAGSPRKSTIPAGTARISG